LGRLKDECAMAPAACPQDRAGACTSIERVPARRSHSIGEIRLPFGFRARYLSGGVGEIFSARLQGEMEGRRMAQEVEFGTGGEGKIRSFWVGLGLTVTTIGIYGACWYYFVNNELKDVGIAKGDENLAQSNPAMSVVAIVLGGLTFWIAPLLSIYNYGQRIKRAQRLTGIPKERQINPITAFLLYFPGSIILVPVFFHFWYVTKRQNMAMRAAGGLPFMGEVTADHSLSERVALMGSLLRGLPAPAPMWQ
jgi:hypothetical protein